MQVYSIAQCSNENAEHPAKKVTSLDDWNSGGWQTDGKQQMAFIEICFEKPTSLQNICIVNSGSGAVEIWSSSAESFASLHHNTVLPEIPLMTPDESKEFINTQRLVMCTRDSPPLLLGEPHQKYSCLRIICHSSPIEGESSEQTHPIGLTFVGINLSPEDIKIVRKKHQETIGPRLVSKHAHKRLKTEETATEPQGNVLQGVVVVPSGIPHSERNHLRQEAVALGAKCSNDWIEGATHLICAALGTSKYRKAITNRIHIVTKQWLSDCYKHKKRMPEYLYHVSAEDDTFDSGYVSDDENDEKFTSADNTQDSSL